MNDKQQKKLILFLLLVVGYNVAYFIRDFIKITNEATSVSNSLGNVFYYGSFISLFTFVYGAGKFFLGAVVDRKNERKLFLIALLTCASANFVFFIWLVVFNDFFSNSTEKWLLFTVPYALIVVMALSQALLIPIVFKVFVNWWTIRKRGFYVSLFNVTLGLGAFLLPWIIGFSTFFFGNVFQKPYDILNGLLLPTILVIWASLFIFFFFPKTFRTFHSHQKNIHFHEKWYAPYLFCLKNKFILTACLVNAVGYAIRFLPAVWTFKFFRWGEFSDEQARLSYALFEFGSIPGNIIFGWLSYRFWRYRGYFTFISFLMMVFPALVWTLLLTQNLTLNNGLQKFIFFSSMMLFGFTVYNALNFINSITVMDVVKKRYVGTATGLVGMFGYFGVSVATFMVGYFSESITFNEQTVTVLVWELWVTLTVGLFLSLFAACFWKRKVIIEKRS